VLRDCKHEGFTVLWQADFSAECPCCKLLESLARGLEKLSKDNQDALNCQSTQGG